LLDRLSLAARERDVATIAADMLRCGLLLGSLHRSNDQIERLVKDFEILEKKRAGGRSNAKSEEDIRLQLADWKRRIEQRMKDRDINHTAAMKQLKIPTST
jgi:hypothetical protein